MTLPDIHQLPDTVHAAIYAALTADTASGGLLDPAGPLVTAISNDVPAGQAYPYIEIGDETTSNPDDSFDAQSRIVVVTLHVWSQYAGTAEAWAIIARIGTLLDRAQLDVTPYVLTECVEDSANVLRDMDGRTRHGVVRYRVKASQA